MRTARPSDWKIEAMPAKRAVVQLRHDFHSAEMEIIKRGVVPKQMEDKWFVYWAKDVLHFHRSWTGFCVYEVHFRRSPLGSEMFEAVLNRDSSQYSEINNQRDISLISYLIHILLLRTPYPFPSTECDKGQAALQEWSLSGRASLGEHPDDA